jgi:hypothetical protein
MAGAWAACHSIGSTTKSRRGRSAEGAKGAMEHSSLVRSATTSYQDRSFPVEAGEGMGDHREECSTGPSDQAN